MSLGSFKLRRWIQSVLFYLSQTMLQETLNDDKGNWRHANLPAIHGIKAASFRSTPSSSVVSF